MKALLLIILSLLSMIHAGSWNVGGRVGARQNGSKFTSYVAMSAEWREPPALSWRTDLEAEVQDLAQPDFLSLRIPTQLLWHPFGMDQIFDPYLGPGASVNFPTHGTPQFGVLAAFGASVHPAGKPAFGLEMRREWPNLLGGKTAGQWSLALTGTWEMQF